VHKNQEKDLSKLVYRVDANHLTLGVTTVDRPKYGGRLLHSTSKPVKVSEMKNVSELLSANLMEIGSLVLCRF
jgi:hypothetical protein